jgi:hypothetical protein
MHSGKGVLKLAAKIDDVRDWIEDTIAQYRSQATPVADLNLPKLSRYLPAWLLQKARTVHLTDLMPLLPQNEDDLQEVWGDGEAITYEAITYGDTIFLKEGFQSEVLYFHELVHVIQWDRLGTDNFLLAYLTGLLECGYRENPLEKIAFFLQESFRHGKLPADVTGWIHKHADLIWQEAAQSGSVA